VELSGLLNRLPIHTVRPDLEKFRNPNGVVLKVTNFAALGPQYPGAGMSRRAAWTRSSGTSTPRTPARLDQVAAAIRAAGASSLLPAVPDLGQDDFEASEGRLLTRLHRVRERDRKLVDRKKAAALARQGALPCEVCGFDFAATYGPLGARFIEAHHILPLALAGTTTTKLADLALVCANCHRMLHRAKPWIRPDQLQERMHNG